jgi:hypothetical protein
MKSLRGMCAVVPFPLPTIKWPVIPRRPKPPHRIAGGIALRRVARMVDHHRWTDHYDRSSDEDGSWNHFGYHGRRRGDYHARSRLSVLALVDVNLTLIRRTFAVPRDWKIGRKDRRGSQDNHCDAKEIGTHIVCSSH